jgi:molecular chaperone IbpA
MLTQQFSIGMDKALSQLEALSLTNNPKYPPYNIVAVSDAKYNIEIALAGFAKEDLSAEYADSMLTIKSERLNELEPEYLYKGISNRAFKKEFKLADDIEVGEFKFQDGLLTISLERIIPDSKKRREFLIQ